MTLTTLAAPTASITSGPAEGSTVSDSNSVSFGISAGPAGATLECKLDAGAFAACTSPKQLSGLADGSHTFSVRGNSGDGVTGAAVTRTFNVAFAACNAAKADLSDAADAAEAAGTKKDKAKAKLKRRSSRATRRRSRRRRRSTRRRRSG